MKLLTLILFSFSLFAHDHGGHNGSLEDRAPSGQMYNLPIHIMLGMQGGIMVHYGIGLGMNHGNHAGSGGAMTHGDMNHAEMGDMNHGDTNHKNGTFNWMIMPMAYLGGDVHKRVINLTENQNKGGPSQDESSDGYLLLEDKRIEVGAGLMVMGVPRSVNWGLWITGGVMPYIGGSSFHQRFVKDKASIKNMPRMRVPDSAEELATWTEQDKMSYNVFGGVMFSAGAGITILSQAGLMYMAQGLWQVSLEKVTDNKIRVRYRKERLQHLAFSTDTMISTLNVGVFKSSDKSFGYIFDLTDADALLAYKHMLVGDLTLAQKFAGNKSIVHEKDGWSKSSGKTFQVAAGIPFLARAQLGKGIVKSYAEEVNFMNGMNFSNHIGVYYDERKTSGVMTYHRNNVFNFMAMHMKMKNKDKETLTHHSAFQWLFERDKAQLSDLKRSLTKLAQRTGVEVPLEIDQEDLGYIRAAFSVNLGEKAINKLIAQRENLGEVSEMEINNFFQEENNYSVCKVFKTIENCKKAMTKRTQKALAAMTLQLTKMEKSLGDKKFAEFTASYTEFGRQFIKNIFTFRSVLAVAGAENVRMDFDLMGEKVPKTQMIIE